MQSFATQKEKIEEIVKIIEDKKGQDIKCYDLSGNSPFYDYSIVCTGNSARNIEAIATEIKKSLSDIRQIEGLSSCDWVLVDSYDVLIHIFIPSAREFYQLDNMYEKIAK